MNEKMRPFKIGHIVELSITPSDTLCAVTLDIYEEGFEPLNENSILIPTKSYNPIRDIQMITYSSHTPPEEIASIANKNPDETFIGAKKIQPGFKEISISAYKPKIDHIYIKNINHFGKKISEHPLKKYIKGNLIVID